MQLQSERDRDRERETGSERAALFNCSSHGWRVHFINAISVSARLKWEQQTEQGKQRERGRGRANEIAGGT